MLIAIAAFGVAFVATAVSIPLASRLAKRYGALDYVERGRDAFFAVPRFGGIAIAAGLYVALAVIALGGVAWPAVDPIRPRTVLGGSVLMLALGIYDDLRGATAGKKLALEIPVAMLTWLGGVRLFADAPWPVSLAVTTLWIVGAINALNLSDGIDGLAGGIVIEMIVFCGLAAAARGEAMLMAPVIALIGAVAGFLCHNLPPARAFMGDSGSLFLGYLVAVALAWTSQRASTSVTMIAPAIALGLPLLDTVLALRRRWLARHPLFLGDLDHIHHRLLAALGSKRAALLAAYGISGVFCALALLPLYVPVRLGWFALTLAGALAAAVTVRLGYLRRREATSSIVRQRA